MKKLISAILILALAPLSLAQDEVPAHPYVKIETTEGDILLELDGPRTHNSRKLPCTR